VRAHDLGRLVKWIGSGPVVTSVNNPPHIYAASPPAGTTPIAAVSVLDSGVWVRQLPQLAEPLAPPDHKAQLTV
jgi:hypothetical protein